MLDNQQQLWLNYKRLANEAYKRFLCTALPEAMKNRLTFLLIATRTGVQRRFSIDKKFFYLCILCLLVLLGAGSIGVWKAGENLELARKKDLLETEQQQMHTISKTVKIIEHEETAIQDLLGIRDNAQASASETEGIP